MLRKGPVSTRVHYGPQPRDFLAPKADVDASEHSAVHASRSPRAKGTARTTQARKDTATQFTDVTGEGRSRRPDPRIPGKHALNPPIVTIFGAGVAGLTAAQELVERGFIVQVVEAKEDPYCPGRPLVGGMAANQPSRVRANVEDLH